ncbi:hypothetical protein POV96_21540, partial [Klebsiella pneumoniae]
TVCVVGKMRDLILQLSKSSIYSTKPSEDINITDPTTATAVGEKMTINIYGDGPNATVFACAVPGMKLFNIKCTVHLSDFGMRGFRAADGSSTTTLMTLGDLTGDNPVSGSSFRRLRFNYSHHNIVINHAFDCYFEQVNVHDIPGGTVNDESTAIDIKAVVKDNTNNLFFNKVHLEQAYGNNVTFLRARKPKQAGSYHHTLDFTGLHVETRRYDARNIDLEGVITSGFRGLHFIRNNTRGGDTTYKVSRRIVTLKDCNNLCFGDGLISHSGDSFEDMIAPILHTGTVKNVVYERMRIVPCNTSVSDIDSYLTNESTDTLLIANVFRDCLFNNFDTSVLVNTLFKLSSRKHINRAHYMTVDESGFLIGSFSNSAEGLSKKDISRLSNDGDLSVASRCAPSLVTVEAGNAVTYILPNPGGKNASKRGVVTLFSKNNLSTGTAIFTTSGGDLKEHANGGLYKIKATTDRVSGYVNVSLSGGNLLIENLTANPFNFGMDFLGFMD